MAYSSSSSDSEVSNDSTCSKSCLETVEVLKSQYGQLLKRFEKSELMVVAYKTGLQSVEERLEFYKKNKSVYVEKINCLKWDIQVAEITIGELRKKLEIIVDNCKKGLGYNAVSPPLIRNFMPPKPDLSFTVLEEFTNEPVVKNSEAKASEPKPKAVRKNNSAPIIEDWVSDSDEENVDCNYQRVVKPVWNNAKRVNHQNFAKKTHPCPKKNMVPRAVLMKSGLVSVNTARQINDAHSKATVNAARPKVNTVKDKNVNAARPKAVVNAARPKAVVNVVKGNNVNAVKASACWVWKPKTKVLDHVSKHNIDLQDQGVIDSGCLRNMTGNMSYLTDYEEIDGGYVAFGGNPKGGKIIGKATKDETNGILKSFITGIENLVDHKVKVIRCDNGTEFKNKEMNQFCEIKEAVNIACYVQNRVLVVKAYNKTLYELFLGRTLTLSFMRPFGCHVAILNTIYHIGKFDGSGPDRLFNIDALTRTMNYKPNVAGTQSNGIACTKASDNADLKSSQDHGSKPSSDDEKKVDEDPRKDSKSIDQEKDDNVNSTNNVNVASTNEVKAVGGKTSIELPDDPNMPALEDYNIFDLSSDDQDDGAKADMNNLDTTIQVSPNLTTRIHKDHPLDQVIGDLQSATQTKRMSKNLEEHRNKKDERGIVIRNKARLVAQGYTKEEGIDYDEIEEEVYVCQPAGFEDPDFPDRVYKVEKALYGLHQAPKAWYETLSTYLLDNGFERGKIDKTLFIRRHKGDILLVQVYVVDIIFGSTNKKLCIAVEKLMHEKFQMSSMEELTFFLGLQVHQKKEGIFISQDKYYGEILKKFRSMIDSLMYLTSSRPDIIFAVCACARYQVNPKFLHLHVVKRIFRHNLLLLLKVNAARHNLLLLLKVNAASHKLTTAGER
ncbi:putative ribonuclease H-like domain-containing protein [Tanacetum coccineum]